MIKPTTRKEIFMNAIATGSECPIKPVTREEMLLAAHAKREASGGGSSGGGGGVTSWNDLEDKPFYSDEEKIVLNYDDEDWRNVTLVSGDVLYYAADVTADAYGDLTVYIYSPYTGNLSYNLKDFRESITVYDSDGEEYSVYCYQFSYYNEDTEENCRVVLFSNDVGNITFDFEGESITLPNSGFYALRTSEDYYASYLASETIYPLDAKFLPKADPVTDATGETVTADEFNALLYTLRSAGYLSE